jgi:hypothetical protein
MNSALSDESHDPVLALRRMIRAYDAEVERAKAKGIPIGQEPLGDGAPDEDFRLSPHPYPGLRSFTPHEGGVFLGRERNIAEIRERLSEQRMVVVLGGYGSGKSSVIRARLMPRLNSTMGIRGPSGNWYAAEFRPLLSPSEELLATRPFGAGTVCA